MRPIITDINKLKICLSRICYIVDERIDNLSNNNCNNNNCKSINDYNKKNNNDNMPTIIVIIDSLNELNNDNEINDNLSYICEKGSRVNVFVILVCNCPTQKVVSSSLKSYFSTRICFKVIEKSISKLLLDKVGAEN